MKLNWGCAVHHISIIIMMYAHTSMRAHWETLHFRFHPWKMLLFSSWIPLDSLSFLGVFHSFFGTNGFGIAWDVNPIIVASLDMLLVQYHITNIISIHRLLYILINDLNIRSFTFYFARTHFLQVGTAKSFWHSWNHTKLISYWTPYSWDQLSLAAINQP